MSVSAVLVGPASPRTLAPHLNCEGRRLASEIESLGGSASVVDNYVEALLGAGASIELVTLARDVEAPLSLEGSQLRILVGPYRSRARDRCKDFFRIERKYVEALIAETSAPVVHAFWTYEFALGALSARRRPVVVTAQDAPLTILRYVPDLYRAIRTTMAVATRCRRPFLVANSPYLAQAWRRQMGYRRPIPVIPNAVRPVAAPADGDGVRRNAWPPIILDVSEGGRLKNVEALVRALPLVLRESPDARLRLVGAQLGPDTSLAGLAERLGVRDSIDFVGFCDRVGVERVYGDATLFVHPSIEESFGMTVGEAMTAGLAIVGCRNAGAVPWLLDGGRAGILADARQPMHIANAVTKLLQEPSLRAELGAQARERSRRLFSPGVVAERTLELYRDVQSSR